MFDIAFSELLIIGVVALIVLGPERLPKVARTVGALLGRLNRYVADVKGDIDREMRLEELRKLQDEMKTSAQKYEILADETGKEIKREVDGIDTVMQAMATTDGGPAMRELEKSKAEAAAQVAEMADGVAVTPALDSPADQSPSAAPTDAAMPQDRAA